MKLFGKSKFIFFDEAGDMSFSPKASRHIVVIALHINEQSEELMTHYWNLKHTLYAHPPTDLEVRRRFQNKRFHASEDPQEVRNAFFSLITKFLPIIRVRALILDKNLIEDKHRNDQWLADNLYFYIYKSIGERSNWLSANGNTQLLLDSTEDGRIKDGAIRGIRKAEKIVGLGTRANILHVSSYQHPFLQVADYFCWAIYKKYENSDERSYGKIEKGIEDVWELFKN
ncbi:MAG: DUF3800 domain-containing protein [Candidatus Marinimicrobia bacterium]|nr:DUF3800 domain-containing protein [Candidatus Neomarinimicrobiota bacterium]